MSTSSDSHIYPTYQAECTNCATKASQSEYQHDYVRKYYAPIPTRTPFLALVLFLVLGCIASIEVAFRLGSKVDHKAAAAKPKPTQGDLHRRQTDCTVTDVAIVYGASDADGFTPTSTEYISGGSGNGESCPTVTITTTSATDETQTTTATAKDDFVTIQNADPTPCYVTQTVIVYYSDDSSGPWSTDVVPVGDAEKTCSTVTVTVPSTSYIDSGTPTPEPEGGDSGGCDTVTATSIIEVTAYTTDNSVVPVGTGGQFLLAPEGACETVTKTSTQTKYITISSPEPTTTSMSGANVAIAKPSPGVTTAEETTDGAYVANDKPSSTPAKTTYVTLATSASAAGGYILITSEVASASAASAKNDYVAIGSDSTDTGQGGVGAAKSDDYAVIGSDSTNTDEGGVGAAKSDDYAAIGSQETADAATPTGEYAVIGPSPTDADGTPTGSLYVAVSADGTGALQENQGTTDMNGATPVSTIVQGSKSYVVFASPLPTTGSASAGSANYVTVVAMPVPDQTSTTATATSTPKADVLPAVHSSDLQLSDDFDDYDYFYASYLSVFVAVLLKEIWSVVFCNTKMMEPFYQLHRSEGATAEDSLLANYLSTWLSWRSFRAIIRGQWVMLFVTLVYGLIAALSPLATETMKVQATDWCKLSEGGYQPCSPMWLLDQRFGRTLQAILAIIAAMIVTVIVVNWTRRSGVFSNPSSIASLSGLLTHHETLEEIRSLDPNADDTTITHTLAGQRFRLDYHQSPSGGHHYGILKDDSPLLSPQTKYGTIANPFNRQVATTKSHAHHTKRMLRDTVFLLWQCALLGVVLGYYLTSADDAFNRFFNSGTPGPRFLLTSLALFTSLHWKTLEREVRVLTPYRRLSARGARPQDTVLVTLNGTPLTSVPGAVRRGEWFYALVATTAALSDVLIVMIAGVPFNRSQVFKAFLASAYSSLAILGLMNVTLLGLFVWRVKNEKMGMPREPDTVVGVAMMLCAEGNGVRAEMEGTECLSGKERDRLVRNAGGRYYAGWQRGSLADDARWVVEKEVVGGVVERHW